MHTLLEENILLCQCTHCFFFLCLCLVFQSCQADLVKDNGHKYFLSVLADPYMPVRTSHLYSDSSSICLACRGLNVAVVMQLLLRQGCLPPPATVRPAALPQSEPSRGVSDRGIKNASAKLCDGDSQTCVKLFKPRLLRGEDGSCGLLGAGCRGSPISL